MIPDVRHADVLRIIARDFPEAQHGEVLKLLRTFKNPIQPDATQDDDARVQLAILKIVNGDLDRIPELVREANSDWRDVLCPAEYPEFFEIGFVGVEDLTDEQKDQLIQRDWEQYQAWLNRG